jgi:hypothetical protein
MYQGTRYFLLFVLALAVLWTACPQGRALAAAPGQYGTSGGVAHYDRDGIPDLFVGAPFVTHKDRVGAVYIYRGSGEGFASDPTWMLRGGDNFGYRFAEVGDINGDGIGEYAVTAINGHGDRASLSGTVTIYEGAANGTVYATLGGERALDKFGFSITGNCDFNADGYGDLVIGANRNSASPEVHLGGAAYVYFGPTLEYQTALKLAATDHTGILGNSTACGDVNGDGADDLVISAISSHGTRWHSSQVLGYYGSETFTPHTDEADLVIKSTDSHFGDSLAVLEDLNGDGYNEVAIGVPATMAIPFPMPKHKGSVMVIKGGEGKRTIDLAEVGDELLTTIYGSANLERFGTAIAPLGDLDSDAINDFAVTALHGNAAGATDLDSGLLTGKVYVFNSSALHLDGTDTQAIFATALSQAARDLHYGTFIAPCEMGGEPYLLVGAPTGLRQMGAVYLEPLPVATP